jgi:hypothetical protein
MKIVAILLIVAGALALAYGGFSYTRDKTAVKLGPLELSVKEKETVNVPVWAGVGAIVVPILASATVEGDELFYVALVAPTGGANLGQPDYALVTIFDADLLYRDGAEDLPSCIE